MGLDLVELVMRVEEEFEIEIGDEEASQCSTPGQLSHLIALKLGVPLLFNREQASVCPCSSAFYKTRRDLMTVSQASRRDIAPKTRLEHLFPTRHRGRQWQQLRVETGVNLPDLGLSPLLMWILALGFGALLFAALVPAFGDFPLRSGPFFGAIIAYGWLMFKVVVPLAARFPSSCETVGGLTKTLMMARFQSAPQSSWNAREGELWLAVQALIADELSVPLEKITPDADFIRDLGAD